MSLQIRTLVSGKHKYLDLFDDEDILMSFSVGEIQDITSKNSGYSKAFTLPGTKNNNEIFNYFYDVNSTPLDFNPNNKFDTSLLHTCTQVIHIGYLVISVIQKKHLQQVRKHTEGFLGV